MSESDGEEYTIPLSAPAPYGSGIKKQGIKFVPASSTDGELATQSSASSSSLGDRYLAIVFGKDASNQSALPKLPKCEICKLPINPTEATTHSASVAHQVCLPHVHPPSAIDRTRKGVSYLQTYGWDPDSRRGLGAAGDGILHPIQPKEKKDKAGIGDRSRSATPKTAQSSVQKVQKQLGRKEIRRVEERNKHRDRRLHEMFYTDDRVERYLGPGA